MAQRAEGHLLGLSSRAAGSSITLVEPELRACYAPPGTEWVSHHQSSSILVCAPLSTLTLGPGILLMLRAAPQILFESCFGTAIPRDWEAGGRKLLGTARKPLSIPLLLTQGTPFSCRSLLIIRGSGTWQLKNQVRLLAFLPHLCVK